MKPRPRAVLALRVAAAAASLLIAHESGVATRFVPPIDDEAAIVHVVNRIGYGPRPGDIERVRKIGLRAHIDAQLHPERLSDNALDARLRPLTTLTRSSRDLADEYERPARDARRQQQREAMANPDATSTPDKRRRSPEMRLAALPLLELSEQKILRAVYSERQLETVLTDFWFNHFNVDARKGPARFLLTEYERQTIRPHVLGNFSDLLQATAKSPAMLFYLDNWISADSNGPRVDVNSPRLRPGLEQRINVPRGLNENYGRELLELHTIGVDGGYTQKDVTEVARAFTGWSIDRPRRGGGYVFRRQLHDRGEKIVLGHRIAAGGDERDGEQVLDILAAHPSTARFIATKLARRFVSDAPPAGLVDRVAGTFTRTNGDLRAVMTTLLTSPEFLSPHVYGVKVKTPFEFVISALRSTGADVSRGRALVRTLQELGMPLYRCQPPTGYKDTADAWVNTGALVNRMNHALALANGTVPGVLMLNPPVPQQVLPGGIAKTTRTTMARASTASQALALALGSPEFQRR